MTTPTTTPYIDLTPAQIARVKGILAQYLVADLAQQGRIPVLVFGSRGNGKGKAHRSSDIDLALITQTRLPHRVVNNLKEAFSASDLPYRVDLLDWAATDPAFRARIEEDGYSVLAPDFFVSYTSANRDWAQWLAWQLEEAGHTTLLQDWDFKPGQNFVAQMHDAARYSRHTLAVLSPAYLQSQWCQSEWLAAVLQDPVGQRQKFVGVRVAECTPSGLLTGRVYIDLVGKAAGAAKADLLAGVQKALSTGRNKPMSEPPLPQGMAADAPGAATQPALEKPLWRSASAPLHFPGRELPWCGAVPADVPHFVGREHGLQQAQQALLNPRHTEPVLIGGPPGVGKTSFAKQLANSVAQQFDMLAWVGADGEGQLSQNYAALSDAFGLGLPPDAKQAEHIQAVRHHIETQARVLLVFDNADFKTNEWDALRAYLPKGQTGSRAIVTSRSTVVDGMWAVSLEVFTPEESAQFWREYLPKQVDATPVLQSLSQDLGHLPLALRQAAAYMQQAGITPTDYAALWKEAHNQLPLLDERSGLQDYPRSLAATLRLSFDQLKHAAPAAHQLLCLCTQFAPDAVPLDLLAQGLTMLDDEAKQTLQHTLPALALVVQQGANSLEWNNLRRMLNASALARCEGQDLSWHRLSHLFLRESQTAEEKQALWALAGKVLVQQWDVKVQQDVAAWPRLRRWLDHGLHWADAPNAVQGVELGDVLNSMGLYQHVHGEYAQVLPLYQRALQICEATLGANHPDTAQSLNNLATLYEAQGDYTQALLLHQRALQIHEATLGANHPQTATSLNNLAELYRTQGEYALALPLCERALQIHEATLGANHPDTATSLNNLAMLYEAQCDYDQALPLHQRALAIREATLGANHPDTATSFNNLAMLYQAQCDYAQALPLHQRALAIREATLGANHPDTAISLNNLAMLYEAQDDYAQALPLLQRALKIFEATLGANHPDTAQSLNNLAALYQAQGEYAKAVPLLERALAIFQTTLGDQHPNTQTILENLQHVKSFLKE